MEFINQIINNYLFNQAKQIRFLMIISSSDLTNRGNGLRKLIEIFLKIFAGNMGSASESILPIVTMVPTNV